VETHDDEYTRVLGQRLVPRYERTSDLPVIHVELDALFLLKVVNLLVLVAVQADIPTQDVVLHIVKKELSLVLLGAHVLQIDVDLSFVLFKSLVCFFDSPHRFLVK
jgi:hypothetical protein